MNRKLDTALSVVRALRAILAIVTIVLIVSKWRCEKLSIRYAQRLSVLRKPCWLSDTIFC